MARVVGRENELARVERFLGEGRERYATFLLEGEAGIGKTTVWLEAVRLAEEAGYTVLRSRPAETEATLAFAALADLLEPIGEDVLARLPEPQRHALDVALLRAPPRSPQSNPRTVATSVLSVLRAARDAPLLVAIDDTQWLDSSSATALSFALRRVDPTTPLAVLLSVRVDGAHARTSYLVDEGSTAVERVHLGPLSLSALYHVIKSELDLIFPRPTLQRVEQASGGNPLFAVELARALGEHGGRPSPGEPLPVPVALGELLRSRIERLPAGSRNALLAAALLSTPTVPLIEAALGAPAVNDLERPLHADVIDVSGRERIRFRHPLLADAVASTVLPAKRRGMHRTLAAVVENEEQRARHLALAAEGPDAIVAARVDHAARLAAQRAAPEEAAELLELACRLTPPDEATELARRRLSLAEAVGRAGDAREALHLLEDLLKEQAAGPVRAGALELCAQIQWVHGTAEQAEEYCEEALTHVGDDAELRARVLVTLARVSLNAHLLQRRAVEALAALERLPDPDPGLMSEALVAVVGGEFGLGRGLNAGLVERGLDLERIQPSPNVGDRMSAALGPWLKADGDFEGARHWLEATYQAAIDEGDEGSLPYALSHLPQLELWTGNWTASEARALEHLELAERTGQSLERMTAIYSLSLVRAHMGLVADSRQRLDSALAEAEGGERWNVYQLLSARGFLDLSVGHFDEAAAGLSRAIAIYEEIGAGLAPSAYEDAVEALVAIGDLENAERLVAVYEERARKPGLGIAFAPALRCRGLIAAARQELDDAVAAFEEALSHHEHVSMPFSRARTLLVLGQTDRRKGERRAARDALEEALAVFEELGAPLWAERASSDLRRVPIRRRAAADGLTPTEERIAQLVAEGKANREVAQELFLSQKTVEANLTRIYRKLGVRSRSGLAASMAGQQTEGPAPPKP